MEFLPLNSGFIRSALATVIPPLFWKASRTSSGHLSLWPQPGHFDHVRQDPAKAPLAAQEP